jgi:hypothetical protein
LGEGGKGIKNEEREGRRKSKVINGERDFYVHYGKDLRTDWTGKWK